MPALAFGVLHTIAATVGQTLVISLFLPGIKQTFALNDAEASLLFTTTTLASAAVLWRVGAWLDRSDVVRYSLACGAFLAFACVIIAVSPALSVLVIGMFCLRLAANGLLVHVALTATARYFDRGRGKALAIVTLGSAIGEGLLPAVALTLVAWWGWRSGFAAMGALGFALVGIAALAVRTLHTFRRMQPAAIADGSHAMRVNRAQPLHGRRFFLLSGPLFLGMWMIGTATVFHQAVVAEAKGLSLQLFAISFAGFAAARVAATLVTGPLVDRVGSKWLFRAHLLPMLVGTAGLAVIDAAWIAPTYWALAGITTGAAIVLQNYVLAERVPPERLAGARSVFGAATIVASALGPLLFGLALAEGASIFMILLASATFLGLATLLGLLAPAGGAEQAKPGMTGGR